MIPQYIWITLVAVKLLLAANLHGKERKQKVHNFWDSLLGTMLAVLILAWGGFFNELFK